ncbi:hypothetical protein KKF55_06480 [Patescibacteria group bacterium]|nr:hypothetical protein [Patescibacteria group bacterium]
MSEYDNHREFLLNCYLDFAVAKAEMLSHVDSDVVAVKKECLSAFDPYISTHLNRVARVAREGIRILFDLHLDDQMQAFYKSRDFGGEEDQKVLMSEITTEDENLVASIVIECRRYLCIHIVHLLFEKLDRQGLGDDLRQKLKEEFEAETADFMERSGTSMEDIKTLEADDWLALQLGRDVDFFYTPELGRDSIGDVSY